MEESVLLASRIAWVVNNNLSWEESFYPTLVEKIKKSHSHFSTNFEMKITPLTQELYLNTFLPLYTAQIGSKTTYRLDLENQKDFILQRIKDTTIQTFLAGVYEKTSHNFAGGILFSVWEDKITIIHRVFNRVMSKQYKKQTTLDFWAESQFREYTNTLKIKRLTHGSGENPCIDSIGLTEFKLKVGALPEISEKSGDPIQPSFEKIRQNKSIGMYFDKVVGTKYTRSTLVYTPESDMTQVDFLSSILIWAGLETKFQILS